MILDAINRISFGNCRRSKGFQVNYRPGQLWKTWFCQYPLKVQICCTFYVEVFLRIHKFNHSMMIQNYCFYLYSHFVNFENMHGYLLFTTWVFIGTDWAIRHAVCVWCRYVGVWMYVSQKMRHNFGSQLHYSHGTEDSAHNGSRGLGTLHCWRKLTTVFPHIVSSLEYFPPLNSFRSQKLLIINSFLPWIVSSPE